MTLRMAYKQWSMAPRNMNLAKNSRDAVEKVLMKKYSDVHLEMFTAGFAIRLFSLSKESREMKVKAASILVYVLSWGGDHGYCQRPAFTYEIANYSENKTEEPEEPMVTVNPEALEKRKKELADREATGNMPNMMNNFDADKKEQPKEEDKTMNEKKTRGVAPKPVVQIDPVTLKFVKVWNSRSEAERELGAKNIDRAISRKGMAKGYYWCNVGEQDGFKPNQASVTQTVAERKKKEKKASVDDNHKKEATNVARDITTFSNDELIVEMKRRGWKGNISITINIEL